MKGLDYLYIALLMLGSYLFANINFARIISKCKKRDITKEGSGNPGTLNMLRSFGFFWGILNMALEIIKGALPSLVGYLLYGDVGLYLCGFSAVLGHIYPVIYKFKGGKGVACTCGMFFVANWWVTLIVVAVCFIYVTITSIGSIGTLGFVLIMSAVELCLVNPENWICYVIIALNLALIFFVHRKNIVRLFTGKENLTNIRGAFKKDVSKIKERGKKETEQEPLLVKNTTEIKNGATEKDNSTTEQNTNTENSSQPEETSHTETTSQTEETSEQSENNK